jgi:hypothetical protein
MRKLASLALLLMSLVGCSTIQQYDSAKVWIGLQIPLPMYEVNIGFRLDLHNEVALKEELIRRAAMVDGYAQISTWKLNQQGMELDNEINGTDASDDVSTGWLWDFKHYPRSASVDKPQVPEDR